MHSEPSSPSAYDGAGQSTRSVAFEQPSKPRVSVADERMNEQSPLLQPRASRDDDSISSKVISPLGSDGWHTEEQQEETKSSWYLLLLTLAGAGLQISWSVEMSYGSPYLLSLGLTKSLLALVWIAGPLSGAVVHPYVGIKSDNCRNRLGKRRPFIIGGTISTIISLMILAWAKEIVGGFLSIFGVSRDSDGTRVTVMAFAVLFVYILDFAINVIQAGIRAFVVDCTPTHQQEVANAWVIRSSGVGNIVGYLAGFVHLPSIFPFLGNSQFKVLCALASFALGITVLVSCSTIKERDPRFDPPAKIEAGVIAFFKSLFGSVRRLPPQIKKVCYVQLLAWIGWFPFLFYSTTYIGEIYVSPFFAENPDMTPEEVDATWEKATQVSTFALFIFAITTLAASVMLPNIVAPTYQAPAPTVTVATPLTPTTPGSLSASGYFNYKPPKSITQTRWERMKDLLTHAFRFESLTLRRAWFLSHLMFAALMWLTLFVRSVTFASILIALVGVPWALTNWAPFALISSEISKRDAIRRGLIRPPPTRDGELLAQGEDDAADQAGVVLGIHNVAIAAPQVVATIVSSAIFKALQKPRGSPDDDSVAWVLRFGGICALGAAYLTTRVGEEGGKGKRTGT